MRRLSNPGYKQVILAYLQEHPTGTVRDFVRAVGVHVPTHTYQYKIKWQELNRHVTALRLEGLVDATRLPNDNNVVYSLKDKAQ